MLLSHLLTTYHSSPSSSHPLVLRQAGSEMALSGKAVSLCFEEKLQEIFPGQSFPETTELENPDVKGKEEEDTDDSDDDFVQPRRKRLKTEEKVVHIKWKMNLKWNEEVTNGLPRVSHFFFVRGNNRTGRDLLYKLLSLSHPCLGKNCCQPLGHLPSSGLWITET